jgi:hypothetical protein
MKQNIFFAPGRMLKLVSRSVTGFAATMIKGKTGIGSADVPQRLKIVIAGAAKSGTTALYYALKQSLPQDYAYKFEPVRYVPKRAGAGVLAKVIIRKVKRPEDFDNFDKRIYLIRDPRDIVISDLLYRVFNLDDPVDREKLDHFLSGVEQKHRDPSSISLLELQSRLFLLFGTIGDDRHSSFLSTGAFWSRNPNYFVYKYEDLIAERFDQLEQYLGFKIIFSGEVDARHRRVERTKEAGGWRDWFTSADVEYYRPLFQDFLVKYDYERDWTLNPNPRIAAEHSTLYVEKMLELGLAARRKRRSGLRGKFKAWRHSLSKT